MKHGRTSFAPLQFCRTVVYLLRNASATRRISAPRDLKIPRGCKTNWAVQRPSAWATALVVQ
jgi:hypothetical protein